MSKFYETSEHLMQEIAEKQRELNELKRRIYDAQVREFYWHINYKLRSSVGEPEFIDAQWKIEFMGKSVSLNNYSSTFEDIENLLTGYMDENEIPYDKGGDRNEFI